MAADRDLINFPSRTTHSRLLILGAPRSGTSLLMTLVGAHGDIAMLSEELSFAIRHLVNVPVAANKLCIPNHVELEPPLLARITRRFGIRAFRDRSVVSLNEYLRDDALKLLIILRNPYANVSSIMERGGHSAEKAVRRWRRSIEITRHLHEHEADRLLLTCFETLLQKTEAVLKATCDFLGLPYDANMMEGYRGLPYTDKGEVTADKVDQEPESKLPFNLKDKEPEAYASYERLRAHCVCSPGRPNATVPCRAAEESAHQPKQTHDGSH